MVSNDLRKQLASLAGSSKTRTARFKPERPTHWAPNTVKSPETGDYFTEQGAWFFIIDCIEQGQEIEQITLDKPPGKAGYVMIIDGHGTDKIYIKLQLGSGHVICRSFHISDRGQV